MKGQAANYAKKFVLRGKSSIISIFPLIDQGVADLHCRSDEYLADEIIIENQH